MKKIAILTSGGDAPGMNAAIRSAIRTCLSLNIVPYVINDGYKGLYENKIIKVGRRFVSETINRGGTIIGTARYEDFKKIEIQEKSKDNLKNLGIEGLITIGGDGTFRGAIDLEKLGVKCIGIPGTIDNDIETTGYTVGFDTALNTIVEALDRIRDTSSAHHRCSIVEVMGRNCDDLAIYSGLASGADIVISNRNLIEKDELFRQILEMKNEGRRHVLIVVSENVLNVENLKQEIEKNTGFETRSSILGQIQRGGKPSAMDRVNGTLLGFHAVNLLNNDIHNKVVFLNYKKLESAAFQEVLEKTFFENKYMYECSKKVG